MDQEELINTYLEGRLSPKDQEIFENLIAQNPRYKAEFEAQRKIKTAITLAERENLRGFLDEIDRTKVKPKSNFKSWLFSATAACVILIVGYFLWTTFAMSVGEKLYVSHYETYPNFIAPSTRGENPKDLKAEAFLAYDNGNFEQAAAMFERLVTQADGDYALLYLGICQLELGRPEKAIPVLSLVSSNSESKPIATWYEALGYFKLNMLDKGKAALQVTAGSANPFQTQAEEILKSLK